MHTTELASGCVAGGASRMRAPRYFYEGWSYVYRPERNALVWTYDPQWKGDMS